MYSQEALPPLSPDVTPVADHLAAVPFLGSAQSTNIILPKWVYIRDANGRYLTIRSGPVYATLTFGPSQPDLDCIFEAIQTATLWYKFRGKAGGYVMRYYTDPGWYSSDGTTTPSFNTIAASGNIVYLKDNYSPSRFFSDELRESGAPLAHDSVNDSSKMEIIEAALKNDLSAIQYNISGAKVTEAPPLVVLSVSLRNDTNVDIQQTVSYAFQKWAVGTWNNVAGRELGTKATFTAGVPYISNAAMEVSVSPPSEHTWGGEEGVKRTVSDSVTVTVPAKRRGSVTIIVRNAHIEVPFTYRQKIQWANGLTEDRNGNGIYNNVDSWHVDVVLKWED